jgi:enoyl-CoA hydratase
MAEREPSDDGLVSVSDEGPVAVLTLDDGKVNALSRRTIAALHAGLDLAADARAIVVCGRPGLLSAGLNLVEVRADAATQLALRNEFMRLMLRLFTSEVPIVAACTGHALGGGAALLLVADRRIGVDGPYQVGFSEVAAGVALSAAAVELVRYRLPMPFFESIVTGEVFTPAGAVVGGLHDELAEDPHAAGLAAAVRLAALDPQAFAATKRAARRHAAAAIEAAIVRSESRHAG